MSLYNTNINTSNIHFQFDKIFHSRAEMEAAAAAGADGIYTGRFVLVKYDEENVPGSSFFLQGFIGDSTEVNGNTYYYFSPNSSEEQSDKFQATTFTKVDTPVENDWESYWVGTEIGEKIINYRKLVSQKQFNNQTNYYIVSGDISNPVVEGSILQAFNTTTRLLENKYYRCVSESGDALWELISDIETETGLSKYFTNLQIDRNAYGETFNGIGYDGTVWQKIFSEGKGKFVLVASLNGGFPVPFELVEDPPSVEPKAPYIDTISSNGVYRIKVPTQWGIEVKEATLKAKSDEQDPDIWPLSDQVDSTGKHLDIYMNLGGSEYLSHQGDYHLKESHKDNSQNKINITYDGSSGKLYGGEPAEDTIQYGLHLPAIGNMLDTGYDLIYGSKQVTEEVNGQMVTKAIRPRDIEWYKADSNFKEEGISSLNYKTYDLKTLAGNINTFHKRLGQNIQIYSTKPALPQIVGLNSNYIYYIEDENKYYRIGYSLSYSDLSSNEICFKNVTLESEQEFLANTYYIHTVTSGSDTAAENVTREKVLSMTFDEDTKSYTIITKNQSVHVFSVAANYSNNVQFAVKDISIERYKPANITYYKPGYFYYISGNDFILDNHLDTPYDRSQIYCTINQEDVEEHIFSRAYQPNYYYKKENKDYILATEDVPSLTDKYYFPQLENLVGYVTLYQKNKYYLLDNNTGEYVLDNRDFLPNSDYDNNYHYIIKFEETPIMGKDLQGNIILIYNIKEGYPKKIWLHATEQNTDYYLKTQEGNFIHISNLEDLEFRSDQFYKKGSTDIEEETNADELFIPRKYYRKINESYHLEDNFDQNYDANFTTFYSIKNKTYVLPFYEASKYYYREGENYFKDNSEPTTHTEHFTKSSLYVKSDVSGRCLIGMEWNDYSLYVPASVELGVLEETKDLIPMEGVIDDSISIHGALLQLDKIYNADDIKTRDPLTLKGAINTVKDLFYNIKHLIPGRILYINDFGQITSSESSLTYQDLVKAINKINTLVPD